MRFAVTALCAGLLFVVPSGAVGQTMLIEDQRTMLQVFSYYMVASRRCDFESNSDRLVEKLELLNLPKSGLYNMSPYQEWLIRFTDEAQSAATKNRDRFCNVMWDKFGPDADPDIRLFTARK